MITAHPKLSTATETGSQSQKELLRLCQSELQFAVENRFNPLTWDWESWVTEWIIEEILIRAEYEK